MHLCSIAQFQWKKVKIIAINPLIITFTCSVRETSGPNKFGRRTIYSSNCSRANQFCRRKKSILYYLYLYHSCLFLPVFLQSFFLSLFSPRSCFSLLPQLFTFPLNVIFMDLKSIK